MQILFIRRLYLSTLAIVTALACGLALAHQGVWGTYQLVSAGDSGYIGSTYQYAALTVRDWDAEWPGAYFSSWITARAYSYTSPSYTYIYYCEFREPMDAAVSRIPDNSGAIGPNKEFSYTVVAPACYGYPGINYPETTITVQCDAGEINHVSSSGGYKYTYADGSKAFYADETERIYSQFDSGINDYTCSIAFTNALGSIVMETASLSATDQRQRAK